MIKLAVLDCIGWPLSKPFEVVARKVTQIGEPASKCRFR